MNLAHSVFLESEIGAIEELPRSGTALENPFVFDSVAKDLKRMAACARAEPARKAVPADCLAAGDSACAAAWAHMAQPCEAPQAPAGTNDRRHAGRRAGGA
jgi:hypothetical protein